ncbi:MAG: hypothetical protein CL923_09225 [Deltaproteobacteria bacterium]|jgi:molybdopterin synthase catalytic subunit|nr:hypothetical protein [Deltaproteobacteria bacterium]
MAAGAPHRKDGFYACHKAVDRIKVAASSDQSKTAIRE